MIDGGSTDGTLAWLESQRPRLATLVSEPDGGVYEAMNKGLARAQGEYVIFLNGGDVFAGPEVLAMIKLGIAAQPLPPSFVYGDALEERPGQPPALKPAKSYKRFFKGMITHHQAMLYRREDIDHLRFDTRYKVAADFLTLAYSGAGQVTAPVAAVDLPSSGEGTSGCESGDFAGFHKGSIALMQRGTCAFATKVAKARAAGAAAAIIFNKPGEKGPVNGTVERLAPIPVVGPSYQVGSELAKAAKRGGLKMRVKTDAVHGKRSASNVVADTRRGRAGNVVLVGAHLDSVPAGPGINDNATGAAALLAVAEKIGKLRGTDVRNRVRFAWWGAEEEGLLGST